MARHRHDTCVCGARKNSLSARCKPCSDKARIGKTHASGDLERDSNTMMGEYLKKPLMRATQ